MYLFNLSVGFSFLFLCCIFLVIVLRIIAFILDLPHYALTLTHSCSNTGALQQHSLTDLLSPARSPWPWDGAFYS